MAVEELLFAEGSHAGRFGRLVEGGAEQGHYVLAQVICKLPVLGYVHARM